MLFLNYAEYLKNSNIYRKPNYKMASDKISVGEVKTLIANSLKEKGVNDTLSPETIAAIEDKILTVLHKNKAEKEIPQLIPELEMPQIYDGQIEFPNTGQVDNQNTMNSQSIDQGIGMEAGSEPTDQIYEPKTGYVPELPSFINQIEPGQLFVFDQNELSVGGENLAKKELNLLSNPEVKKSIHQLWVEEGKKKADVYIVKFEKLGELDFDYLNGTARFIEQRVGINDGNLISVDKNTLQQALQDSMKEMGLVAEEVKEEKVVLIENNFNLKVSDLTNDKNGYTKVSTPSELLESIQKDEKKYLVKENNEIREFQYNNSSYFVPVKYLSLKKCYTKK